MSGTFPPLLPLPPSHPFVWGRITEAMQDASRQGFGKKTWASLHWMGQYFVISYLSAVLALYCQAIWMPPGLMCLFSCHSKGSWEYLSSFSRCRTEAKWHIQSYPENLRWSKELVSFLLDYALATEPFFLLDFARGVRLISFRAVSGSVGFHTVMGGFVQPHHESLWWIHLCFPANTSRSILARKRARLLLY